MDLLYPFFFGRKLFSNSGPFFKAKFILFVCHCSIYWGSCVHILRWTCASQFSASYFMTPALHTWILPLVGSMLPPRSIGYSKLDSEIIHFIVNSNLPPLKLTFSPTSWLEDASFPWESDFCPHFFHLQTDLPFLPAELPNQEAELLKLGHQLLHNAASKADAKRRSFHQQKVSKCKPRSCEGWVDDSDDILVVEFGAGKWSILKNWDCFGIYRPLDCLSKRMWQY